jgi:DNA-binding NarL/FixJ family response regulator
MVQFKRLVPERGVHLQISLYLQILPDLKKIYHNSRFIIYDLDAKDNEGIKYLRSGAHGYLSKKSDLDTLSHCIQTVLDGKFYIDPKDLHTMLEGLTQGNRVSGKRGAVRRLMLTDRQNEIANLFAEGMSTSSIAKKLGLSPSTISTVKSNIYQKLKIDNVVDLREALS